MGHRNPERIPEGQVWTQNECLGNGEIKRFLGLKRPENIVKVSEKVLWVIEAKRTRKKLGSALEDAKGRAEVLNKSKKIQVKFISGVAGNSIDGFIIQTEFMEGNHFQPITWNGVAVTGLLWSDDLNLVLRQSSATVENPTIDEKQFFSRATAINEILHLGAVNPHQRAGVMAALLLAMLSDTGPNIEERSPTILINDINARVHNVLTTQGKAEFYEYIKISLPSTADNHLKFRQALVETIQELNGLNIKSAMNSGDDWLGAFYEVFLKYASWAQDLGIVLTPRHLTRWAADVVDIGSKDIVFDISQIIFKSNPMMHGSHRRGKEFLSAAIRRPDFGDWAVFGSPFRKFSRHPDTPLPSFLTHRVFPRPTPERVFVANHQSGPRFSETSSSAPRPRPIGT